MSSTPVDLKNPSNQHWNQQRRWGRDASGGQTREQSVWTVGQKERGMDFSYKVGREEGKGSRRGNRCITWSDGEKKKERKKKSPSQGDAAESCLRNMIVWNEWRQLWKRGEGRPQIFMVLYTRALSIIPHRSASAPAQLRHLEAALLAHNYTLPCHLLLKKQTKPQRFEDTTACRQQPQTPPPTVSKVMEHLPCPRTQGFFL